MCNHVSPAKRAHRLHTNPRRESGFVLVPVFCILRPKLKVSHVHRLGKGVHYERMEPFGPGSGLRREAPGHLWVEAGLRFRQSLLCYVDAHMSSRAGS